ncbi:hypothetical protein CHS0354_011491 [Potamilus streckersoni]|uniref:Uncharacterized protein n=1 Tax=Potamilus streckersoni TaxID=2493646 RepID=A0AAE0SM06_9BIVA|nr:hypothetical protein CHS0354_011491 [Potamilus streckersoni]
MNPSGKLRGKQYGRKNLLTHVTEFNKELQNCLNLCNAKGYEESEIRGYLENFINDIRLHRWKLRVRVVALFAVLILPTVVLIKCGISGGYENWLTRNLLISVLPYWNWPSIYDSRCLMDNPKYTTFSLSVQDCEMCEDYSSIQRLAIFEKIQVGSYLTHELPLIISNGSLNVLRKNISSVREFAKEVMMHDILSIYHPCGFSSNLREQLSSKFYAHWENCAPLAAKEFRLFYSRPPFLPAMLQLDGSNWVMLCSDFDGTVPKRIQIYSSVTMFMVIKGNMKIALTPKYTCKHSCRNVTQTLENNDLFLITDFVWDMYYIPNCSQDETIVFGVGGRFE